MAKLEELTVGAHVQGILPNRAVTVVSVRWYGDSACELVYEAGDGQVGNVLLYRDDEPKLEIITAGRPWSFDGDGELFRLVSEAHRIRLAYLFDPLLAVHTSLIEPLPHQITAVYGEMLSRQPLRYLLADDPGAGKTIMAGLLIKELMLRGDLRRCLIVCPGSLVEQWQDELDQKFGLPFEIMTNDKLEAARSGNWLLENDLVIARLDKLARDENVQAKLEQTDWDLIICDEAHKMSATYFAGEIKYTKRYHLGQLLGRLTRHFLLMTATPHNGKEEDFQLFMALLDSDRFEGRFRDGVHVTDTSDLMRRLVKEQLVRFDGTPLFPERIAYTVTYTLSDDEARLYRAVTDYVREEFNRADTLANVGSRGTVGFALTTLQRRLASSPEAIYQSLRRRRERLERRLREEQLLRRGASARLDLLAGLPHLTEEDWDDLDEAPEAELAETEDRLVDQASAARTIAELEAEIDTLRRLEALAEQVRRSGRDRKWEELADLLQSRSEMFDARGHRRKLVIFTEHRDTLNYLHNRVSTLLGRPEAVVVIHGGMGREDRKKAQEAFIHDPQVQILIATDAAGEGINLQRAHLMVNYDLPWNPNRLEQRFGRIHRIGQTEVCHLWNLVARETREGDVYARLLEKLEQERQALGGKVFDVLGRVTFDNRPLRELLLEAIRYGDRPEVRARLTQVIDRALDRAALEKLLAERALAHDIFDAATVQEVREQMERAAARRLQPHHIGPHFLDCFRRLGGTVREREPGRYQVTHVPAAIRARDRQIGTREPVLPRYERITFKKELIHPQGQPMAAFVCPGHPLLDATIDLMLERYGDLLTRGAVLVDPADLGEEPRVLFYLEHTIQDARTTADGRRRIISRQLQFVELSRDGTARVAGYAPHLEYRPLTDDERPLVAPLLDEPWLREGLAERAKAHAIATLVPEHVAEVRQRKEALIARTKAAVHDRLTKEIIYWDRRATELRQQEEAGKTPRLNSAKARQRVEELTARLHARMAELEQERQIAPLPPVVVGGALIVPAGLLARLRGEPLPADTVRETKRVERLAMQAVMEAERRLGYEPRDVSADKRGWDIESRVPQTGALRFIEVKGRVRGADTVTVTRNEIIAGLNKPDDFILALVEVDGDTATPRYVRRPFHREPDFAATSVNYNIRELLAMAEDPS
ncbi:MAG: helicase-related protein [Sphaerobacter sp.]|nr:helicase-related protein [Sphaerobacter sp.]